MENLNDLELRNIDGGNCFFIGLSALTTPGIIFHIIDDLDGDSYIRDCWNDVE